MKYELLPDINTFIANKYTEDETNPLVDGESAENIKITNGIRQGWNLPLAKDYASQLNW